MNRIEKLFATTKARIAYFTAGDGGMQHSLHVALALIAGNTNVLEIGIPFSDPIADGPVIERASQRALKNGVPLQDILTLVKNIRCHSDIPIILFSYLNPILSASHTDFFIEAQQAGVDGLLLVDCPFEESHAIREQCQKHDIDLIYVITPSTSYERLKRINQHAQGFLYYACRKGITGTRDQLPEGFSEAISSLKQTVQWPIVVGFGISNANMANQVLTHADGVVVGSLFVKAIEEGLSIAALTQLAREVFIDYAT